MIKKAAFAIAILATLLTACKQGADKKTVQRFKDLLNKEEYFRLKTLLDSCGSDLPDDQRLFYQAVLSNKFNQCDSSNTIISNLFKNYRNKLSDSVKKELFHIQAYNYIRQYQYAKAVKNFDSLIHNFPHSTGSAQLADLNNSKTLWAALKNVPPQTVSAHNTTTINWTNDKVGLIQIPVSMHRDTADFVFDTGANISVVTKSIANKWHIKVFNVSFDLGGGTGFTTKSDIGMADSLYVGDVLIRNAVFLVLPDDMLYVKQINYRQQGIFGLPIMAQLKEWQFKKDGTVTIPQSLTKSSLKNMVIDGLMPLVNFKVLNTYLPFRFDSGANSSTLYSLFFERFKSYILANGQTHELKEGGVGGIVITKAYTLHNFTFTIGDKKTVLPKIDIRTKPYNKDDQVTTYGNLGQDIIKQNKTMTINFSDMFIRMD